MVGERRLARALGGLEILGIAVQLVEGVLERLLAGRTPRINGDGLQDFVTGKRWWAHGGNDPGGDQPAVMYWFELKRENGQANWVPHSFDHNSGVGTQFQVADVNEDGLLDIVTANKKGVFYFPQGRK